MRFFTLPLLLAALLALPACTESTPQPSPGAQDTSVPIEDTSVTQDTSIESDSSAPLDSTADGNASDLSSPDTLADTLAEVNPAGCPDQHPWLTSPSIYIDTPECDLPNGTVCRWPAEGCQQGAKPDNICTCKQYGNGTKLLECEVPFHTCLPLAGSDVPEGTKTRPAPAHREAEVVCLSTVEPRQDPSCAHSREPASGATDTCSSDADCTGEGARCLDSYPVDQWTDGGTLCQCFTSQCTSDQECNSGVCQCGATNNADFGPCGGYFGIACMNRCLPSDCRTDADCGSGGLCSPSRDMCGWSIQGYHCHYPEAAECLTDYECYGRECRFEAAQGWFCSELTMCD